MSSKLLDIENAFARIRAEAEGLKSTIIVHARNYKLTSNSLPSSNVADRLLDQPAFLEKPLTYIIASERRSGSHLLASLLRNSQQAGVPLEYFHGRHWEEWRVSRGKAASSNDYLYELLMRYRTTPNGIFSFKAHWDQYAFFSSIGLEHYSRGAKFIKINRRDKLAQAVSLAIARQTKAWSYEQRIRNKPKYSFKAIQSALLQITKESLLWTRYLECNCIKFHEVFYEDICADRDATMQDLCKFLGIKWESRINESTKLQRTNLNLEWQNVYQEEASKSPMSALSLDF
jgi:LPS sulfotransferase NodH